MLRSSAKSEHPHLRVVAGLSEAEPPKLSDDELIDAIQRGDRRTAELLYDRLGDPVGAALVRVIGRRDQEHDDLVQGAFEQILLTLVNKRFARACSLTSWAVAIATKVALTALRKRSRERKVINHDKDSQQIEIASGQAMPDDSVQLSALRQELSRLSETTAEVVLLHEVMGYDMNEIAALTGLSAAAAQSRLVRGRAELCRRLQSRPPEIVS